MNPYCSVAQLFALYDSRTLLQLSGDQNSAAGQPANIQTLLDLEAGELNTYLNGRFSLPIPLLTVPAVGMASFVSVPADNTTTTIGDGKNVAVFTYLNGGTALGQINTATGNTSDIAAILAAAVNVAGISVQAQARLFSVALVNTVVPGANPPSGYAGNVPIITTSPAVQVSGMMNGSTKAPDPLTKLVAVPTAARLFARRNDRPKQISDDMKWRDDWLKLLLLGAVSIPGVPFAAQPRLEDSNFPQGSSFFDYVYGTFPSPTSPINTTGNVGQV